MPLRSMVAKSMLTLTACALAAAGCAAPPSTPTPNPQAATSAVIRQVLVGVEGDNNVEFIELYNPADAPFSLDGYRVVYRLATSDEDLPVALFDQTAIIPPGGFYLLARDGAALSLTADGIFQQSLNDSGGGLGLLNPDGMTIDAVGWGRAPESLSEGAPASQVENGTVLLRRSQPGAPVIDTDANDQDFVTTADFQPHNSGSPRLNATGSSIALTIHVPDSVDPGQEFSASFRLANKGETATQDLVITIPLPPEITLLNSPTGANQTQDGTIWQLGSLAPGDEAELDLALRAPWRFGELMLPSARAIGQDAVAFAGPHVIALNESPIPIDIARGLVNQDVMVEGTATTYTDGLFAGSGNVKFYISDDSGGVQVWVPGGEGTLRVAIGDPVRVRGRIERYRGTIELISEPPSAIEPIDGEHVEPDPIKVSLDDVVAEPEAYAGQLIRVQGELSQADESSFGYDLQVRSDSGLALFGYIDKMTGLNIEQLTLDQPYALTGVLETPDGVATLYPRVEEDLDRQYPSSLLLQVVTPPNLLPAETATIQLELANHTDETVRDLIIRAPVPADSAGLSNVSDSGQIRDNTIEWSVDQLGPGEAIAVTYGLRSRTSAGEIHLPAVSVESAAGQILLQSEAVSIFVGDTVPIYAIQGPGDRSPFVGQAVRTQATVTAVFPDLGGFFIQGRADQDQETSEGIFVAADPLPAQLQPGDELSVSGTVREIGHQPALQVGRSDELDILRSDQGLPDAIPLNPLPNGVDSAAYYEALEGMLVAIDEPAVAIGPTNQYGETPLVLARYDIRRILRDDPYGRMITVDDGSDFYHEDRSTMPFAVTTGQLLNDLTGPLAFTFGQYKIEPLNAPQVTGPAATPAPIAYVEGAFSVMTWNAENLFDILEPNPSSPPRPHKDEYDLDLEKVASTIKLAGAPTIVALQEIENIGILEDLAELFSLEAYAYQPLLLEGTDSRGIDVGYLVRSTASEIVDLRQVPVPDGLTSRPPLELIIDAMDQGQPHRLVLLNNHFTALSAGVELTAPRRQAQARLNADTVQTRMQDPAIAGFIVLGDLNSFYQDPALSPLEAVGMTDALANVPSQGRYTYIYQGISQVLDHIYLSEELSACLHSVEILHADADFPPPEPNDPSALRKSDHDPVIATFDCLP
ncbi:MAG: lamin tail domain-containing protein [Anaerolineales bacterium]